MRKNSFSLSLLVAGVVLFCFAVLPAGA